MRIISKFSDYYDSGQAYSNEKEPVYIRETSYQKVQFQSLPSNIREAVVKLLPDRFRFADDRHYYGPVLLFVCGRVYGYWGSFSEHSRSTPHSKDKISEIRGYCCSPYSLATQIKGKEVQLLPAYGRRSILDDEVEVIEKKYTFVTDHDPRYGFVNQHFNAPVVYVGPLSWSFNRIPRELGVCVNPVLGNDSMQFYRHLDSYSVYQEIRMFLDSALVQEDKAPHWVGDDKIIAAQKGFDPRYSFRTRPPGNKKENRKLNKARKRRNGVGLD